MYRNLLHSNVIGCLFFCIGLSLGLLAPYQLPQIALSPQEPVSCIDNDGLDITTAGGIQLILPEGKKTVRADQCENDTLIEYACVGVKPQGYRVTCQQGCYEGACIMREQVTVTPRACTNLIWGAPRTSEASSELGKYTALQAVDGDPSTHWFASWTENEPFLIIDKGQEGCVTQIETIFFSLDLPLTLRIESSSDKHTWQMLTEEIITDAKHTSTFREPRVARYFKFTELNTARGYCSLSEVRLLRGEVVR